MNTLPTSGQAPQTIVAGLNAKAERFETPCGDGTMVWRVWGQGPALVLLHGGHGSWTHWIRNIAFFAERHRVAVPDMPGYGESALPQDPDDPESIARPLAEGLHTIFPERQPVAVVGFSFGGIIAGHLARLRPDCVSRVVLVGAGGLGLPRPTIETLKSWRRMKTDEERREAHRRNLQILMLHDPASIDDLALHLQAENTARTHINSPAISRTDTLRRCLYELRIPVAGIWGERDATTGELLEARRELLRDVDAEAEFTIIPRAGHWAQYEAADEFNACLEEILASGRKRDKQALP